MYSYYIPSPTDSLPSSLVYSKAELSIVQGMESQMCRKQQELADNQSEKGQHIYENQTTQI